MLQEYFSPQESLEYYNGKIAELKSFLPTMADSWHRNVLENEIKKLENNRINCIRNL